jgi:hypothetical protein
MRERWFQQDILTNFLAAALRCCFFICRSAALRDGLRRKESFFCSFTQHLPLQRASAPWAVLG